MARCSKIWVYRELGYKENGAVEKKYIKPHADFESGRNHARNLSRKYSCTATVEVIMYEPNGMRESIFETYTNGVIVCDNYGEYVQDESGETVFVSWDESFKELRERLANI